MMSRNDSFIPQQGYYESLAVYKIAKCLYAITYQFANTYLQKGDRTIDQMIQAARSGKQNIAEGCIDGNTSKEMEIKLLNVARGSMHELKADYEDYLMNHQLEQWNNQDERTQQTRRFCKTHNDPQDYIEAVQVRSDETIANIALTMLHQFDVLMVRLIEAVKQQFLEQGGIKEEMYRARTEHKNGKI